MVPRVFVGGQILSQLQCAGTVHTVCTVNVCTYSMYCKCVYIQYVLYMCVHTTIVLSETFAENFSDNVTFVENNFFVV